MTWAEKESRFGEGASNYISMKDYKEKPFLFLWNNVQSCAVRPGTCIKKVNRVDLEISSTLNKVYDSSCSAV